MALKTIGENTITEIETLVRALLESSQNDLDQAYKRTAGTLNIGLGIKVSPDSGINEIKAEIKFNTSEKFSLDYVSKASESQMDMFPEDNANI